MRFVFGHGSVERLKHRTSKCESLSAQDDNGARKAPAVRSLGVSSMELDERGLLMACPNCGKRNRLRYEGLGRSFRCGQCKTEIPAPDQPIDVGSDLAFDALIGRSAVPVLVDFWAPW